MVFIPQKYKINRKKTLNLIAKLRDKKNFIIFTE